jgi:hypothetical protein
MKSIKHSHRSTKAPKIKGAGNFSKKKGKTPTHHTHGAGSKRTK